MRFCYFVILSFVFSSGLFAQEKKVMMKKSENNFFAPGRDKLYLSSDKEERYKKFTITRSRFDVETTINRIKQNLEERQIPVFALFDHGKNAREVGLDFRPTQVIVFGSPGVGTLLMQENQLIALELPLKIAVWEDAEGKVWVGFLNMKNMARKYGLEQNPITDKMQLLLEDIVKKSI